jgi:hypothetical protein
MSRREVGGFGRTPAHGLAGDLQTRGRLYCESIVVNEFFSPCLCASVVNRLVRNRHHRGTETQSLGRRRLLSLEDVARLHYGRWIDGDVSFVDVLNDAFFVDQEGGAVSKSLLFIKNAIVFDYSTFEIAEDRKRNADLLCKFSVGGNAVYTHSENLSFS